MWELSDPELKAKIASFAGRPDLVTWSRSADRDIGSTAGATRLGVLEAILDHLACEYVVHADYMENGDLAYIFRCFLGARSFYLKVKFVFPGAEERMHVFSAHFDR